MNEVIQGLKAEALRIVDIASGVANGGQIVEGVMGRMKEIDTVTNNLQMIRAHMESLQQL